MKLRPLHRVLGVLIGAFTVYFAVTGVTLQLVDLRAIAAEAAATDPDMMAIRESIDGPPNYEVIVPEDYAAAALPADFDFQRALSTVVQSVRAGAGDAIPLQYLELRSVAGRAVGLLQNGDTLLHVDATSGALLPSTSARRPFRQSPSLHNEVKRWHRMQAFGDGILWFNTLIALGLFAMMVTGLVLYFQLLRARSRAGRKALFWSAGGAWRSLHRWVSIVAAAFIVVVSLSGALLSVDSLSLAIYRVVEPADKLQRGLFPIGMTVDASAPLRDSALPTMLATTLAGYRSERHDAPIKSLRLRYFAGMPQGVVISGGKDTRQLVFNAVTGKRVSSTETGYPYTGFPFGWAEHEIMKKIHRGDILGVPGRSLDLLAGLSIVFLAASGLVMYCTLWSARRRVGRKQLFWS